MSAYGADGDHILRQFGANLGVLRASTSLSQEKLAEKANLHRTYIGKLEGGKTEPGMFALMILADALGVPVGRLVDDLPRPKARKLRPADPQTRQQK
jgi:transcriptional regulator with XRE-family HTH domain